jgi:hypothetical protein
MADTFVVCVKSKIRWGDMQHYGWNHCQALVKAFIKEEEKEIIRRVYNADELVFEDAPDRKKLQAFFNHLGRNVIVLPKNKVFDLDRDFNLVVRSDIATFVSQDVNAFATEIAIWEEIGFKYDGAVEDLI